MISHFYNSDLRSTVLCFHLLTNLVCIHFHTTLIIDIVYYYTMLCFHLLTNLVCIHFHTQLLLLILFISLNIIYFMVNFNLFCCLVVAIETK